MGGLAASQPVDGIASTRLHTWQRNQSHGSPQIQVCQTGDTWLWVDRTERDPKFYVDGGATLPAALSALFFESTSPGVHGTLEIEASSLGRTPTVALAVRAGHPDLAVLQRLALCTRTFSNGTAHMALTLPGAPPASPVWLDIALTLPGPAYARHGPRRAPDLAVRVAATNISATHLIGRVGFDSLSLTTTDGGIDMGVRPPSYARSRPAHARRSRRRRTTSCSARTATPSSQTCTPARP
jgi:hypothetical protein